MKHHPGMTNDIWTTNPAQIKRNLKTKIIMLSSEFPRQKKQIHLYLSSRLFLIPLLKYSLQLSKRDWVSIDNTYKISEFWKSRISKPITAERRFSKQLLSFIITLPHYISLPCLPNLLTLQNKSSCCGYHNFKKESLRIKNAGSRKRQKLDWGNGKAERGEMYTPPF